MTTAKDQELDLFKQYPRDYREETIDKTSEFTMSFSTL